MMHALWADLITIAVLLALLGATWLGLLVMCWVILEYCNDRR